MSKHIIKLNEYYLEWSTVVDAPTTKGMILEEFQNYYERRYSDECRCDVNHLSDRLDRVEKHGTSSYHDNLNSLLSYNRAGDNEEHLTIEEIIAKYCPKVPNQSI